MVNRSIACNVRDCKYHAQNENYCTLNAIQVVNHTTPATTKESTDCGSFEKNKGSGLARS
ncbi:DUF1540 domain-containing protein [Caloramator sp. Dgby_cultured_2]|uniref:DUF1540 domain-containing protein n=1 Tax=Caloramator sp. Dgby_cultured_2 TaxID=3029174 RepID=UPI00237E26E6|nr:DUF1540 domain-containing protein [Caloramator sp. Dgby_cultured_2]WDU83473.1 DUF1540 domain-containing protein [Caloramator sp. Dgby_cultured_2]